MKVARTVLRGGKIERSYLSQQKVAGSNPATLTFILFHSVNIFICFFVFIKIKKQNGLQIYILL